MAGQKLKKTTILIIDDDPQDRSAIARILRGGDLSVELLMASSGMEGMERLHESSVDLVITDICMPDGDGIQVITTLRELEPDLKILAMTGGGMIDGVEYLSMAQKLGVTHTILKDDLINELCSVVAGLLEV